MGSSLDPETEGQLEEFVTDWLIQANIPGASLAVVKGDDLVYTGGFGSRNLETNKPATSNTLYGIGSCTKPFTALSILMLEERGELSVDDSIITYLDEIEPELDQDNDTVTIHDLLTHSSGMPSLAVDSIVIFRSIGIEEYGIPMGDSEDFYRHLNAAQDEVADSNEERFMYFNSGYTLLGEIIEATSGMSYNKFVEAEILRPLGMERSTFDPDEIEGEDRMKPYVLQDDEPKASSFPREAINHANGGLITSVKELAHYIRLQTNGGSLGGVSIVSKDTLEQAHIGYMERVNSEYGYGWNRSKFLGRTVISHGGSTGVSSAYIGFTEDGKYGIAIGANTTSSPNPATVAKGVLALLESEDPHRAVPYFARMKRFDELTGEYESYRGITKATVDQHGDVLQLTSRHALGESTEILLPVAPKQPGYKFEVPTMNGTRETAEFKVHGNHIDLYYGRHRLHKQS